MAPQLRLQPMPLHTGSGAEAGGLVLAAGRLVGRWHLEAGFGPCAEAPPHPVFDSLDAAFAWVNGQLAA